MIDEMKEDEQQADSVTVDVQTGERSDDEQAPTFGIVEHTDGKKYIAAEMVEEYRQHKTAELAAMQTEIDGVLEQIAAIEAEEAAEKRQQIMADFVTKNGDDYDMSAVTNFENEAEFIEIMDYLQMLLQSSYSDSSAGWGPAKQAEPANSYKNQYERGAAAAREIYEKRGRR